MDSPAPAAAAAAAAAAPANGELAAVSQSQQLLSNDAEVAEGRIRITLPDGTAVFADLADLDGLDDTGQFAVVAGRELDRVVGGGKGEQN